LTALGIRIWTRAFIARGFRWDDGMYSYLAFQVDFLY
jgi:hypothetical protein